MKTGLLVVSFGTTHLDTLEKTIAAAERDLAAAFPGVPCYRAFTSGIVRERLRSRQGLVVDSVPEALARMRGDGVERAVVQPTLLIPGEEFDRLRAEVLANAGDMAVSLGLPLLWDDRDLIPLTKLLERAYPMEEDQVLLAMGHGTDHSANGIYHRLARCMAERSGRLALCTVEGTPSFQDAIDALLAQERRRVHLAPLLLVAGDHSKNDMAGDGPDSLRTLLEQAGFQVTWSLRGLGELPEVREKLVRRARSAFEVLPEK